MDTVSTQAVERLTANGLRPSPQRVAVMEYLLSHRTHPTVDEIYSSLLATIPTLSRTTVYNTLRSLGQSGAVLTLTIDADNTRYDGFTHPYAHFLCGSCGKVYDVEIKDGTFAKANAPEGAVINDVQLYYRGTCRNCNKKENKH